MEGSKFHFSKCSIIMIPILTKKLGGKWGGGAFCCGAPAPSCSPVATPLLLVHY